MVKFQESVCSVSLSSVTETLKTSLMKKYSILFEPPTTLPPNRDCDLRFEFIPGSTVKSGKIYPLSLEEQAELQRQLEENLAKGFICSSSSPWSSPVLFADKKNGELRLVVDYRDLNYITVKNNAPLPLIGECLD